MVDDVAPLVRSEHDRNHVLGKKGAGLVAMLPAPLPAFGRDLAHADGDLGGTQLRQGRRVQYRLTYHLTLRGEFVVWVTPDKCAS
jgi:hypothetical protein